MSSINTASSDSTGSQHAGTSLRSPAQPSRYESQKRRDWNTFGQYLKNHRPPLALSRCSGAHVLEFLRYLDQFGKTKVHISCCPFFGQPNPPSPCPCPLKQAWGSLDALVGRLRAAFEENGGQPETNPFGARAVRLYLREVRDSQSKARGIAYEKKKRKKLPPSARDLTAVADLNDSVYGGCDRMDQIYHENYGRSRQFVLSSSSGETSTAVNATGGGSGGLFGGSDERLLLFQCPGSLL